MRRSHKAPAAKTNNAHIMLTPRPEGPDHARLEKAFKKIMSEIYCRGVDWVAAAITVRFPDRDYCYHKPAGAASELVKRACCYVGAEVVFPD